MRQCISHLQPGSWISVGFFGGISVLTPTLNLAQDLHNL